MQPTYNEDAVYCLLGLKAPHYVTPTLKCQPRSRFLPCAANSNIPLLLFCRKLKMAALPLLQLRDLACYKDKGQPIFTQVNLAVTEGEILILQGKSGSGSGS